MGEHACWKCGKGVPASATECLHCGASQIVYPGCKLGSFVVDKLLNRGGMADLWSAKHATLGRECAVKVLSPRLLSYADPKQRSEAIARFTREAKVASLFADTELAAHFVSVFDFGELSDGSVYYLMDLLTGESLEDRLRERTTLDLETISTVFAQVCRTLAAVHEQGVIHRDLKPANVHLVPSAEGTVVKLLDFGIAHLHGSELTGAGDLLGTPDYMAPEQWTDASGVGPPADLYSVGCMLYRSIAGRLPFSGSIARLAKAHLETTPDLITDHAAWIAPHPAVARLVHKLLAKRAVDRPTATEAEATLRAARAG